MMLNGVWGARVKLATDADSLTLALGEQDGQIRGFAVVRHSIGAPEAATYYSVRGSRSNRFVEVHLGGTIGNPSPPIAVRAALTWGLLAGTTDLSGVNQPIELRRAPRSSDGVEGTWALASTTGPPLAIRDTIVVLADGRGRRHREEPYYGFGTLAMWTRHADWLVLRQFAFVSSVPSGDSLRIEPNALVRTTRLFDGTTITETYQRVQ